jgi:predicted dithiol-disulfide oxidoreductase (DUF899 family)
MGKFHQKQFPGEGEAYRKARDELLQMEIDLRKRIEEVAAFRRTLPLGGKLKDEYVFEEGAVDLADQVTVKQTRFSELFAKGKQSLIIYSFMYAPEADKPCPMCTSILDGLNGNSPHVNNRVNFAVIAKAPIQKIRSWALSRGWKNLRLLSSLKNTYNADYFAENSEGSQLPALNVFQKTAEGIYHFYNTELLYVPPEKGQNPRHVDLIWPLWNLFDLTPEGRGTSWFPKFSYE